MGHNSALPTVPPKLPPVRARVREQVYFRGREHGRMVLEPLPVQFRPVRSWQGWHRCRLLRLRAETTSATSRKAALRTAAATSISGTESPALVETASPQSAAAALPTAAATRRAAAAARAQASLVRGGVSMAAPTAQAAHAQASAITTTKPAAATSPAATSTVS